MRITQFLERVGSALPPDIDPSDAHEDKSTILTQDEAVRLQLDQILAETHPEVHSAVHKIPATILAEKAQFLNRDPDTGRLNISEDQLRGLMAAASIAGAAIIEAWVGSNLAEARDLEERFQPPEF